MSDKNKNPEDTATEQPEARACGIIMPISATANHSSGHWVEVLTLITRAVEKAKFVATPVWQNSVIDRVSKRIIENIFKFPIVIADISDSNPNVMLELGLRLASKKPTIVIMNKGGNIPFDIHDFHALTYPASLSILEMEKFVEELAISIESKYEAYIKDEYTPFLDNVVVDVVKPGQREVSLDKYVLDKLDELSGKISRISSRNRPYHGSTSPSSMTSAIHGDFGTTFLFSISKDERTFDSKIIAGYFPTAEVRKVGNSLFSTYWALVFNDDMDLEKADELSESLESIIRVFGGKMGIPSSIAANLKLS